MKCPKCSHEQSNTFECKSCGIIFEKYAERQKLIQSLNDSSSSINNDHSTTSNKKWYIFAAFTVFICSLIYMFLPSPDRGQNISKNPSKNITTVKVSHMTSPKTGLHGIAKQLDDAYPPGNNIERARNATVFIKTAWGFGSGFFIDDDCHIITNRHVVEFDEEKMIELRKKLSLLKQNIEKGEKIIADAENKINGISDDNYRQQYREKIEERIEKISEAKKEYEDASEELDEIQFGFTGREFKVILIDNTEFSGMDAVVSEVHDLALLKIDATGCPYIEAGNTTGLKQGERLYTIGNPEGLKHTVTSGVVSGYRKISGNTFIQTDASINPGNSGGPLVDHNAKVVGVNTMIYKDTEGIGFAIPIETVLSEFDELKNK